MVDDAQGRPDYIVIGPGTKAIFEKVLSEVFETKITKRLQRSVARIKACGGKVMIHHTPHGGQGGVIYQLLNGRSVSKSIVSALLIAQILKPSEDGLLPGCDQTLYLVMT